MTTLPSLSPGTLAGGRYKLLRTQDDRGLGEVWAATDTHGGMVDALVKVLGPVGSDRGAAFRDHAEFLRRLREAHVLSVNDAGDCEGRLFLALDPADGRSLESWLAGHREAGTRPGVGVVQRVFDRVCVGIQAAHNEGMTAGHGCLTPRSVLLQKLPSGDLHVKVMDFGLARFDVAAPPQTLEYMAPEQEGYADEVMSATDVFALGVLLVEMLTTQATVRRGAVSAWWQVARDGRGAVRALLATLREDVPGGVWDVVATALNRIPEQRYPNAGRLRSALRQAWRAAGAWEDVARPEPEPPMPRGPLGFAAPSPAPRASPAPDPPSFAPAPAPRPAPVVPVVYSAPDRGSKPAAVSVVPDEPRAAPRPAAPPAITPPPAPAPVDYSQDESVSTNVTHAAAMGGLWGEADDGVGAQMGGDLDEVATTLHSAGGLSDAFAPPPPPPPPLSAPSAPEGATAIFMLPDEPRAPPSPPRAHAPPSVEGTAIFDAAGAGAPPSPWSDELPTTSDASAAPPVSERTVALDASSFGLPGGPTYQQPQPPAAPPPRAPPSHRAPTMAPAHFHPSPAPQGPIAPFGPVSPQMARAQTAPHAPAGANRAAAPPIMPAQYPPGPQLPPMPPPPAAREKESRVLVAALVVLLAVGAAAAVFLVLFALKK